MLWWTLRQLKSSDPATRRRAAEKLGLSRNSRAVEPLVTALRDEEDSRVCEAVARALALSPDPRGSGPFFEAVLKYLHDDVQQATAELPELPRGQEAERALAEDRAGGTAAGEPLVVSVGLGPPGIGEPVRQLVALYDRTPRGEGFLKSSRDVEPVRAIGRQLDQQGGFDLMLQAHAVFARERPRAARNLEMVWDGIGGWQG